MRRALWASLCLVVVAACSGANADGGEVRASGPSVSESAYPGNESGARALLEKAGTEGGASLVETLRPTNADYRAVFQPEFADRAERFYRGWVWGPSPMPAEPWAEPGQTVLRMWKATTEEIRAWTPSVRKNFPGGYRKVKGEFRPGLTIYTWDYTEPGAEFGMAFNGLVFVNGHWALFPKPWRVLDQ